MAEVGPIIICYAQPKVSKSLNFFVVSNKSPFCGVDAEYPPVSALATTYVQAASEPSSWCSPKCYIFGVGNKYPSMQAVVSLFDLANPPIGRVPFAACIFGYLFQIIYDLPMVPYPAPAEKNGT